MNKEELELVVQLIDDETDLVNLKRIRRIICDKISNYNKNGTALDEVQIDILLKPFVDFSDEIGVTNRTKYCLLRHFNYHYDISADCFKVYHLLKIGGRELIMHKNIGKKTLAPYEEELNKYNLSLKKPLTLKQVQVLERREEINIGGK